MPRSLKTFLEKKKPMRNCNEQKCLLLSAWRDYDINGCNCEEWWSPVPTVEEKIILKVNAYDDWTIRIPISSYNLILWDDIPYDWNITIDWGTPSRQTGISIEWEVIYLWEWLTPWSSHTVEIKPVVEEYWWAKAFGAYGVLRDELTEIVYDKTYMWYAESATSTWTHFRAYQYENCGNLTNTAEEYIPEWVTIGSAFRSNQYEMCSKISSATIKACESEWSEVRIGQFLNCGADFVLTIEWDIIDWASKVGRGSPKVAWFDDGSVSQIRVKAELVDTYKASTTWGAIFSPDKFVAL